MKVSYSKTPTVVEQNIISDISNKCGILYDTARLLYSRKIDTVEKVSAFLDFKKSRFYNPLLLKGMEDCVKRIEHAKDFNEKVLIYGDYDADGVSAVSVLYYCLKDFGVETYVTVPERQDGYGLSIDRVKPFINNKNVSLLITVDCGISEVEKIDELKKLGIDVLVTDHHEPPEILPNCTCVNPKIKGQEYPFDGLCGAGVAYKLGYALVGERADKYLDLVALATVADSMDLIDENRLIVQKGLSIFNSDKCRLMFKYLTNESNKEITAQTLAFVLAPRVNAGGRMGDADCSLKLFLSENPNEIFDLSVKLNEYNILRQAECDVIYKKASEIIKENALYNRSIILVKGDDWNAGFIGIVAARLVEDYNRPVIVFSGKDGFYKGSARSVEGINVHDAISSVKDILLSYGGHAQAAGVSVKKEYFDEFSGRINKYVEENCIAVSEKTIQVEWEIKGKIDERFAEEINMLEPFGTGNKKPFFSIKTNGVESVPFKEGSMHYSFKIDSNDMIDFNGEADVLPLSFPINKTVVFEINYSEFRHVKSLKCFVKHVVLDESDFSPLRLDVFRNELLKAKINAHSELKYVEKGDIDIKKGLGTIYVLSDIKNIEKYPEITELKKHLFTVSDKVPFNCVLISPNNVSDKFNKVVYLDNPLFVNDFGLDTVVRKDLSGKSDMFLLSTEREDFSKVYNLLIDNLGSVFINSADFYRKHNFDIDEKEFVFCTEVFLELGFFTTVLGKLIRRSNVKSSLNNSNIYNKVCSLKDAL